MKQNPQLKLEVTVIGKKSSYENANCDVRIHWQDRYSDINDMLATHDFFISLSRFETFQYAIAEALYGGLPVIKSNCEGTNWANDLPMVQVINCEEDFCKAVKALSNYTEADQLKARKEIEETYGNQTWCRKIESEWQKAWLNIE